MRIQNSYYHYNNKVIGTRHGEKLFETLVSREELYRTQDQNNYFLQNCNILTTASKI